MIKIRKSVLIIAVAIYFVFTLAASATNVYVAAWGNDGNPGTAGRPYKTFSKSVSMLMPGDTLFIYSGTYNEQLNLYKSGTANSPIKVTSYNGNAVIDRQMINGRPVYIKGSYIQLSNLELRNSIDICLDTASKSSYLQISGMNVHDCMDHGVQLMGSYISFNNSRIYNAVLKNQYLTSSWGSALKVSYPGNNIIMAGNTVYNSYGEGIGITQGTYIYAKNNNVYNDYSVNIYVDNSKNVEVEKNLVTCTNDRRFFRDGYPATGIAMAEENYGTWGAQLSNIKIANNIVAYCRRGVAYFGSDVPGAGGLANVNILYNTFYGIVDTGIVLIYEPYKTYDVHVGNNIVQAKNNNYASIGQATLRWADFFNNFWAGASPAGWMNVNGPGDKTGDPLFAAAPSSSPGSFRLGNGSPARWSAKNVYWITDDFESKQRYSYDIGAIEYKS